MRIKQHKDEKACGNADASNRDHCQVAQNRQQRKTNTRRTPAQLSKGELDRSHGGFQFKDHVLLIPTTPGTWMWIAAVGFSAWLQFKVRRAALQRWADENPFSITDRVISYS